VECYPNEIDIYDLGLDEEILVDLSPYLNRRMATEYYVYGLDTHDGHIAAAWLCPNDQTAEWVYQNAKRLMDSEHLTGQFQFGYIGIASCTVIQYTCDGVPRIGFFRQEDFTFAASLTKKPVLVAKKYHRIANDLTEFMYHAGTSLEELLSPNDNNEPETEPNKATGIPPVIVDASLIEPIAESSETPPIFIAASGKGKSQSTKSAMEAYNESKPLAEPPDGVIIERINIDVLNALFQTQYEALLASKYADDVDEWHLISKKKYNGKGWADIARSKLEQQKNEGEINAYKQSDVNALARNIENQVKAHRKNLK
jgi:hypothetical protein